jgi:hypothetical protein
MQRQKLIKRLRSLRNLEFFNIFFLPACLYFVLSIRGTTNWQAHFVSMMSICVILAQGVFYWHLKLQSIRKSEITLPAYAYQIFSFFKRANLLLFVIYPGMYSLGKTTQSVDFGVSIWSNLLYIFGILEYVNYYHYQLSHDNLKDIRYLIKHKKIRRSPLWTDLAQNRERSQS